MARTEATMAARMELDGAADVCRPGDLDAFETAYRRHHALVFRYAYHMLANWEEADDAAQDTFVRAFQALHRFRGDCPLETWLLRICANTCRDRLRSRRRGAEMPAGAGLEHLEDPLGDPALPLERRMRAIAVRAAIASLRPAEREVIVLRDLEGLGPEETARVLGCSRACVHVRLFRARRRLKDRLAGVIETEE